MSSSTRSRTCHFALTRRRSAVARLPNVALVASAVLVASAAGAQVDIEPPPPNVMLLVDSSGSMEYKSSSSAFPACDPTGNSASEKSRWVELVEVLAGSIPNYRCAAVDRTSTAFKSMYSLSGVPPADADYSNPYHRPLSGTCMTVPGTLPLNPYDFGSVAFREFSSPATPCGPVEPQADGLLEAFGTRVRFGLMTFDTHPNPGRGAIGNSQDPASGVAGTWSYFVSSSKAGKPAACDTLSPMEVGARNAAAPPWEGKMVAFGAPTGGATLMSAKTSQIKQILLSTRPYGATPIAGMLDDVRDFLRNDTSKDPLIAADDFGPYDDPFIKGGCRGNFVILLSDGEPNMDLRPFCEGAGPPAGVCPYGKPEDIAFDLANATDPNQRTKVFVIGFAVSNVTLQNATPVNCANLTDTDLNSPGGLCASNPDERALQACCTLSRIAYNGGTTRAYFADDKEQLRAALSAVLSSIVTNTSSRTLPVFASSPTVSDGFAAGYRFFSSFEPRQFSLWSGILERQRYVCEKDVVTGEFTPEPQPIDRTKGDDFAANVNSGVGDARRFFTVLGQAAGPLIHSRRTIRPELTTNPDGVSNYVGTEVNETVDNFPPLVTPAAMAIDAASCPGLTAVQCRDRYLRWVVGLSNGTAYHRCASPGVNCDLVGDIFRSTPRIVGRPSDLLRDETYQLFAVNNSKRPVVLYTSTNDGMLRAFKVAAGDPADTFKVDSLRNNELWSFIPPAVLPSLPSQYPGTHSVLLDGVPVVKDVVAILENNRFRFERSPSAAQSAQGTWRTVLVQGFGGSRGGYFALDVTEPAKGPRFLWQVTEDASGQKLFGTSGTPLITTLYFDTGNNQVKEVAVAVLPGGDSPPVTGSCNRADPTPSDVDSRFPARAAVPCYGASVPARSLTIVRLDTGEIIRSFRGSAADAPASLVGSGRVTQAPLDSPITGTPVAFPGTTGAIADRAFVGDRDGALWRVDLSSTNPGNWSMKLFFDVYSSALGHTWSDGHPIQTPPVLSVDEIGNVTVALSTGDQEVMNAPAGMATYAFSLTEKLNSLGSAFESRANWYTKLVDGERVAGPMTLFNGALFFSTFKPESPSSANVCSAGSSRVWGVDYLQPKQPGSNISDLEKGGFERLPEGSNMVQFIDSTSSLLQAGAVIFGVGVTQLPSCVEEVPLTDPYFGAGTHTSVSNVTPGKFQLVMHTGAAGDTVVGGKSKRLEIELPTPPSSARIDSWAALIE